MKAKVVVPLVFTVCALGLVALLAARPELIEAPMRGLLTSASGVSRPALPERPAAERPAESAPTGPIVDPREAGKPQYKAPPTPGEIRFGRATAIAKPAGAVRVATYNVENFFDPLKPGEQPGLDRDEGGDGDPHPVKPAEDRKAVAAAIHAIDADVLALQEIESEETLTKFRDEYLSDMGYAYLATIDAGDARGIEQSVLSRLPLRDVKNWPGMELGGVHPERFGRGMNPDAGKPIRFKRSPLQVTVDVPGGGGAGEGKAASITLLVVHHKSGAGGTYWRLREASKTIELARQAAGLSAGGSTAGEAGGKPVGGDWGESRVVVLGDFNAGTGDQVLATYLGAGFVDAMGDRPAGDPAWITHTSERSIDHVFLTPGLAKSMVAETRFVLGTITRAKGVDWRVTATPPGWASDHYPVVVDLKLR